jgi:hypothetical protein
VHHAPNEVQRFVAIDATARYQSNGGIRKIARMLVMHGDAYRARRCG